ncbi:PROTEIN TPR3-LIKE [Salix koriyanagi]|uniref:PROTEIN TPR3-LIKE n=1 Tax=Salix koriyanagi TaxID=2511006 RepID=A0A9Q0W268_9ROSI|nr:PROTEIN TPR3-LIKE [Salix koriyanagi]
MTEIFISFFMNNLQLQGILMWDKTKKENHTWWSGMKAKGAVKRNYNGLAKRSEGDVKFDPTNNRFLAAGDEFKIKFWDMDNSDLLTTIDAEGGLPASPCIRFNKEGSLLVVSTKDNGIKILANSDGIRLLRTVESRAFDDPRAAAVKINSSTICLVRYLVLTQWGYASKTFCYSIWSEA